jgi:hypothetical protein
LKWRIIAIVASVIPLIIIGALLNVGPDDILSVGIVPFVLASVIAFAKLLVQCVRYHYFVKSFVGPVATIRQNTEVRIASEFVTLTTPAFIGGEFVRVAWLNKIGVHPGKGMWIITAEVISDVLVGSILAFIAAGLAFAAQNYIIAIGIVVIAGPIFAAYMALLFLSSKTILQLPRFSLSLLARIFGPVKAEKWINTTNDILKGLCEMSRENLRSSSLKIFAIGLGLTFVGASLHALTFMVLANTTDDNVGFFESLMAVAASVAIGTLPISPGGSGLSEFGIGYYLTTFGLDPILFGSIIIAWRIASYHVILAVSWVALMKLAVGKIGKSTTNAK